MSFDVKTATVKELVNRYHLQLHEEFRNGKRELTGQIALDGEIAQHDNAMEGIKARRDEVYDYLMRLRNEKIKAAEERQAKIDAIEGLKELEQARLEISEWNDKFRKSFDDVGGAGIAHRPTHDLKALAEKYPRAAAYLKAENWAYASNYEKAAAGKKARERIINGEDYKAALHDMEEEWSNACKSHIWD